MIDLADIAEREDYRMPPMDVSVWTPEDKFGLVNFVLSGQFSKRNFDLSSYSSRLAAVALNYQDTQFDLAELVEWVEYAHKHGAEKLAMHVDPAFRGRAFTVKRLNNVEKFRAAIERAPDTLSEAWESILERGVHNSFDDLRSGYQGRPKKTLETRSWTGEQKVHAVSQVASSANYHLPASTEYERPKQNASTLNAAFGDAIDRYVEGYDLKDPDRLKNDIREWIYLRLALGYAVSDMSDSQLARSIVDRHSLEQAVGIFYDQG